MSAPATNEPPWRRVRLAGMRKATGPETRPDRRWRWDATGVASPAGTRYEAHLRRGLWLRRVQTSEPEPTKTRPHNAEVSGRRADDSRLQPGREPAVRSTDGFCDL